MGKRKIPKIPYKLVNHNLEEKKPNKKGNSQRKNSCSKGTAAPSLTLPSPLLVCLLPTSIHYLHLHLPLIHPPNPSPPWTLYLTSPQVSSLVHYPLPTLLPPSSSSVYPLFWQSTPWPQGIPLNVWYAQTRASGGISRGFTSLGHQIPHHCPKLLRIHDFALFWVSLLSDTILCCVVDGLCFYWLLADNYLV